jgi:ferritin-like metal-binding protein YciE
VEKEYVTPEKTLNDLFYDTLNDIYFAERQILKTLPKLAKATTRRRFDQTLQEEKKTDALLSKIGANQDQSESRVRRSGSAT